AQVRDAAGDVIGATQDFEHALELADGRSEPLLVFYAVFLNRMESFDQALSILEPAARGKNPSTQLLATYGWTLVLVGRAKEAAAVFEDIHQELFEFSSRARTQYITQYAEALKRAAQHELRRGLFDEALDYALRAMAVVRQAAELGLLDDYVVKTGQECV